MDFVGWLPTYYQEKFNLSQTVAGVYATAYLYPASIFGVLLGGFLADRWLKSNPSARILVPLIGLCVAGPCIFLATKAAFLSMAAVSFFIYALTKSFSDVNMMPILCMVIDSRYRATGYGILNLMGCIVGGIGLYAGGALRDAHISLNIIFQCAFILVALCIMLLLIIKSRTANKHQSEPDLAPAECSK